MNLAVTNVIPPSVPTSRKGLTNAELHNKILKPQSKSQKHENKVNIIA